jgi:hypothetical protein
LARSSRWRVMHLPSGRKLQKNPNRNLKPPNPPWVPIEHRNGSRATLCYYCSDHRSAVPVRDVSYEKDPKPDPHIETKTYGLFSYCGRTMRKSIVEQGIKHQFFCTVRSGGTRILTGYYHTGWYFEVRRGDFMIAAKHCRFVSPGFPLPELVVYLEECPMDHPIDAPFRDWRYIPENVATRLLSLVYGTPDATALHKSEIRRLERWSLENYGHMYLKRQKGFRWEDAARPMRLM